MFAFLQASALLSSKIIRQATVRVYPGAPHGLMVTHKDQLNNDLFAYIEN